MHPAEGRLFTPQIGKRTEYRRLFGPDRLQPPTGFFPSHEPDTRIAHRILLSFAGAEPGHTCFGMSGPGRRMDRSLAFEVVLDL